MTETLYPTAPSDPADFNVEAWLQDAALPEESCTVYKRPDVIAELSDLKRRIELEARVAAADDRTAGDAALTPLEQEYVALLETFSQSALTIYVRALTEDELRALRTEVTERTKALPSDRQNEEFGLALLAGAIVAVKPAGGDRAAVKFTPARVKALTDALGQAQVSQVLQARLQAQNALPTVDADFLLKRSGGETGPE